MVSWSRTGELRQVLMVSPGESRSIYIVILFIITRHRLASVTGGVTRFHISVVYSCPDDIWVR